MCKRWNRRGAVESSYSTRNPRYLVKRLSPHRESVEDLTVFYWIVRNNWLLKIFCKPGLNYRVEYAEEVVFDEMSNLNIKIRKIRGFVDKDLVWESVWMGSKYSFKIETECSGRCPE